MLRPIKRVKLRPTQPNLGLERDYAQRLFKLIDKMCLRAEKLILAAYRRDPPAMAEDQEPPFALSAAAAERLRQLAEGEDPRLLGPQAGVIELEQKGLIERAPVRQYQAAGIVWRLTDAGEEVASAIGTPAARLSAAVRAMAARWQERFNEAAPRLAEYFLRRVADRSQANLKSILKAGGYTVRAQWTPNLRDVMRASVEENVSLIRTIPSQYFGQIEQLVMRSVARGRDLETLSKDLRARYGVTKRRAELIARDQNNKATSALIHAREADLGIRQNVWMHSHAGKEPRPEHVKMNERIYDVTKGMWDAHERKWIFPGELINCRCTSRPVLSGTT